MLADNRIITAFSQIESQKNARKSPLFILEQARSAQQCPCQQEAPTWSSSPMSSTGRLEYSTLYRVMNQSSYAVCEEITESLCHKPEAFASLTDVHSSALLKQGRPHQTGDFSCHSKQPSSTPAKRMNLILWNGQNQRLFHRN